MIYSNRCKGETKRGDRCGALANATGYCAWHSGRGRHCSDNRPGAGMVGVRKVNEMLRQMRGGD